MKVIHRIRTYGFDPGLRHGILVRGTFDWTPKGSVVLASLDTCFSWPKKHVSEGIGEKSPPVEVYELTKLLIKGMTTVDEYMNHPVCVDFDPISGFWRSRRLQLTQMGFFMGYFSHAAHALGHPVTFLSPSILRKRFGLKHQTQKEELWDKFIEVVDFEPSSALTEVAESPMKSRDIQDALILAYMVAEARYREVAT